MDDETYPGRDPRLEEAPAPESVVDPKIDPKIDPKVDPKVDPKHVMPGLRRLHVLTVAIEIFRLLRTLALPLVIFLILAPRREGSSTLRWIIGAGVVSTLVSLARYLSLRYGIVGDQLLIRSGILFRKHRNIPLARIQNIGLERGPLLRALGLADVKVETAGSSDTEVELSALSVQAAETLKRELRRGRAVARGGGGAPSAEEPGLADASASPGQLVRASSFEELFLKGATESRLGAIVIALFGLWELAERLDPDLEGPTQRAVGGAMERLAGQGELVTTAVILAGIFLMLLAGWVGSILLTFVQYHGFRLSRTGGDLKKSHGLLTRREGVVPLHRVQLIRLESNPLRRLVGALTIRAVTAGSKKDEDGGGATVLSPLIRTQETADLCRVVFPRLRLEAMPVRRVHRLAIRRGAIRFLLIGGVLALLLSGLSPAVLMWMGPVVVIGALLLSWLRYRAIGFSVVPPFLLARSGLWTRRTWIIPMGKIQSVTLRRSPFQRRLGLATLAIDTAGSGSMSRPRIIDLDHREAADVMELLSLTSSREVGAGGI